MIDKDDRVRSGQGQPQSSHAGRQEQNVDAWIPIEGLDNIVSLHRFGPAVETHERHAWHVRHEQLVLDDIEHLSSLAEDQDSMLRSGTKQFNFTRIRLDFPNPTVPQKLSEARHCGCQYGGLALTNSPHSL